MRYRVVVIVLAGAIAAPLFVEALAYVAWLATGPLHDPDEGANMAGLWGYLLGPVIAAAVAGYLSARYASRYRVVAGYVGAVVAATAGQLNVRRMVSDGSGDTSAFLIAEVAVAMFVAVLVTPALLLGRWRARVHV